MRLKLKDVLLLEEKRRLFYESHQNIFDEIVALSSKKDFTMLKEKIMIPNELVNPPEFNESMYPLNTDQTAFKDERPYCYLTNFRYGSYTQITNEILKKAMRALIEDRVSESRLQSINREIVAVIYALEYVLIEDQDNILLYIMQQLVTNGRKEFPFYESRTVFHFIDESVSVIIPKMLYMILGCTAQFIYENINYEQYIAITNQYLTYCIKSPCDMMLSIKGKTREWLEVAMDNQFEYIVPEWNLYGNVVGEKVYSNAEKVLPEKKKNFNDYIKLVTPLVNNEILMIIKRMNQSIMNKQETVDSILKFDTFIQIITNSNTYYRTITDLSVRDAIKPNIVAPQPIKQMPYIVDKENGRVYAYHPIDEYQQKMYDFVSQWEDEIAHEISTINMNEEFFSFLKMTGAGRKLTEEELAVVPDKLKKLTGKRLVQELSKAKSFKSLDRETSAYSQPVRLGEREQNDRRQRNIAGVENKILQDTVPVYKITSKLYPRLKHPSSGKQHGDARDIDQQLYWTSLKTVLHSEDDVNQMDATTSDKTTQVVNNFAQRVSLKTTNRTYSNNDTSDRMVIIHETDGTRREQMMRIPALTKTIAAFTNNSDLGTSFISPAFGLVINPHVFGSGIAPTGTQHTKKLTIPTYIEMIERSHQQFVNTLHYSQNSGDDSGKSYYGKLEIMYQQAIAMRQAVVDLGFNVEAIDSVHGYKFLQQPVYYGRSHNNPARISLTSAESKEKQFTSVQEVISEISALADDLSSRCYNVNNLRDMVFWLSFFCASRQVIRSDIRTVDRFTKKLKEKIGYSNVIIHEKQTNSDEKQEKKIKSKNVEDTRLISVIMPTLALTLFKCGEIPGIGLYDDDGEEIITEQSYYTPRGECTDQYMYRLLDKINKDKLNNSMIHKLALQALAYRKLRIRETIDREKEKDFPEIAVANMARTLEQYGEFQSREKSRIVASRLKKRGVDIPDSLVYGRKLETTARQIVDRNRIANNEHKDITFMLMSALTSMTDFNLERDILKKPKFNFVGKFAGQLDSSNEIEYIVLNSLFQDNPLPNQLTEHLRRVSLAHNLTPGSDGWLLLCLFGFVTDIVKNDGNMYLGDGPYGRFKDFEQTMEKAQEIYYKNRSSMGEFFDVINVPPHLRTEYITTLRRVAKTKAYLYKHTIAPRKAYFISKDITNLERFVDYFDMRGKRVVVTRHVLKALLLVISYTFLLSNANTYDGTRIVIFLSDHFIENVLK